MSEGRMECEMDRWFWAVSGVLRALVRTVVVKGELSREVKFSIY